MPWDLSDPRRGLQPPPRRVLTEDVLQGIVQNTIQPTDAAPTIPGITGENFPAFVLDCLWAVVEGDMEAEVFPRAVRAAGPQEGRSSKLAYTFLVVWSDLEGPKRDSFGTNLPPASAKDPEFEKPLTEPGPKRMVEAVKETRKASLVTASDLMEVLDVKLLLQADLTSPASTRAKSISNALTNARVQRAQKIIIYLSFREEMEGYAKLLTLLNNGALATLADATALNCEVDQLTGFYCLAPLKVAYCTLCAIEQQPAATQVLTQLSAISERTWCHTALAIRMLFPPPGTPIAAGQAALPQAFFDAVAALLAGGKAALSHVLHCLGDAFTALAQDSWTGAKFDEAMGEARAALGIRPSIPTAAAFRIDIAPFDHALAAAVGAPPPFKLLLAMLRHGEWPLCETVIAYFAQKEVTAVAAHREVADALLERIAAPVQELHAALFTGQGLAHCVLDGDAAAMPQAAPLPDKVVSVLEVLGPMAFRRRDLLAQLWRLVTHILYTHAPETPAHTGAYCAIQRCLLGATMMLPVQTIESALVWQALAQMRQVERFRLYYETAAQFDLKPRNPELDGDAQSDFATRLMAIHVGNVDQELSLIQKKAYLPKVPTADRHQEVQHSLRMMSKCILSHPLAAAARIVNLCQLFDNMCDVFITFSAALPLIAKEMIVAECVRVCMLRTSESELKEQQKHYNLCTFLGKFIAANEAIDLYSVFLYVAQGLRAQEHPSDVQIIEAIFQHSMGDLLLKMSSEQRACLASGPALRSFYLKTELVTDATLVARAERFYAAMQGVTPPSPAIMLPLFVLLAQQMALLVRSLDRGGAARTSTLIVFNVRDRAATPLCMGVVLRQLAEKTHRAVLRFLNFLHSLPTPRLLPLLPSLRGLRLRYEVAPECALPLLRPALRDVLQGWDVDAPEVPVPAAAENGAADPVNGATDGASAMDVEAGADGTSASGHTLAGLSRDVLATVPGIVASGALKFDPRLYLLFWALELPDIHAQRDPYAQFQTDLQAALGTAKQRWNNVMTDKKRSDALARSEQARGAAAAAQQHGGQRSTANEVPVVTAADVDAAEGAVQEVQTKLKLLPGEREAYAARRKQWAAFFEAHVPAFRFASNAKNVMFFVQECVVPRCLWSMEDAVYSARFLAKLAECRTPNFSVALVFDHICRDVIPVIRCCTDQEASNLIVFMKEVFVFVDTVPKQDWFDDVRVPMKEGKEQRIDSASWTRLVAKWQKRTATLLAEFIRSSPGETNVCVRNSLRMVAELSPQFPCSAESDRTIRAAITEALQGGRVPEDVRQLLFAAERALDSSKFKPKHAGGGGGGGGGASEDGRAEEGELVAEKEDGAGGAAAPRGRGANMGAPDVGHKRGREHSGNMDAGRRAGPIGRSGLAPSHRGGNTGR